MRNLEFKISKSGVMTMGYQFRLLEPELVFRGQLCLFLDEIRKSSTAGRIAIELAAASVEDGGKPAVVYGLNFRVFAADSPENLYRLYHLAYHDVCAAFAKSGIAWKKARFDDEGTVGVMPVRGYSYLAKTCRLGNQGVFYADQIGEDSVLELLRLHAVLTANPDSGVSLQLIPTMMTTQELQAAEGIPESAAKAANVYLTLKREKSCLYAFTFAVWGLAAEELTECVFVSSGGSLSEVTGFVRETSDYDDVTIDPWNLHRRLCENISGAEQPLRRVPCLITAAECANLFGKNVQSSQNEQKTAADAEFFKKKLNEFEALTKKDKEELVRLNAIIEAGVSRDLQPSELAYLGAASGQELGMSEIQLDTLKDAVFHIRPMGVFEGTIIEANNYFRFTSMLGYLYELLMKECYHKKIYEPYCEYKGKSCADPGDTDLICYENGPGKFTDRWDWKSMAEDMSRGVRFGTERWSQNQWFAFFQDINSIRKLRNKVHVISKSGDVSFVGRNEACEGIRLMLSGSESLMRRILLCKTAETVWGRNR